MKATIFCHGRDITLEDADTIRQLQQRWQAWRSGDNRSEGVDLNVPGGVKVQIDYRDIVRIDITN